LLIIVYKKNELHLFTTCYAVILYTGNGFSLNWTKQIKFSGLISKRIIRRFTQYRYLKKTKIVCFLLLIFSLPLSAPGLKSFTVFKVAPIEPYKSLAYAIGIIETKGDTMAYNPLEAAAGIFQIRPIRLIDYNKRTGSNYTREDLFVYEISKKIFLFYADQIGPYNLEQIARKWNGSGRETANYWRRTRKYL
jgi:hypothetical protein